MLSHKEEKEFDITENVFIKNKIFAVFISFSLSGIKLLKKFLIYFIPSNYYIFYSRKKYFEVFWLLL